jgi:hypothetical protein
MKDNFDLKKFLTENKTFENFNPYTSEKEPLNENTLRERIREMILTELNPDNYDYEEEDIYGDYNDEEKDYFPHVSDLEDSSMEDDDIYEAKKKKEEEVEDVEVTDTETEDLPGDMPEETPPSDGGLEDIAANMGGTESELMQNLMDALKIAKGMNNEKLETQIGNTLKFFVSEYIGGGEQ